MTAPASVFGASVEEYANAQLPAFPVHTRLKRPAVRGWRDATPCKARAWARKAGLAEADGLGLLMGKPSGITEIDVDGVGDSWLGIAVQRFGETPIIIRTPSGKSKIWYRHTGERRQIRPFHGLPIDVLGGGFSIAPPSWRHDLGAGYSFQSGGLADLDRLPAIRSGALDASTLALGASALPQDAAPLQGQRNASLWRWAMSQAPHCTDFEALLDVTTSWASAFPDPLPSAEVQSCAKSAWRYQIAGQNYLGHRKPQVCAGDAIMDTLIDRPEAFTLLQMLQRWHRGAKVFAIAPRAMSEAKNPPWPRRRIEAARDLLLERGFIEEVSEPCRGAQKAGRYRLASALLEMPKSGHNHCTPLSPLPHEAEQILH